MDQTRIYDDYSERHLSYSQVQSMLKKYLKWCKQNKQQPEVKTMDDIDESNIGHVVYHAEL